jgi:hypothetical protein
MLMMVLFGHSILKKSKRKDWLAGDNMFEWSDMSTDGLLVQ